MPGHAEFAHNKNIERNTEPLRYFKCDRHTSTRQSENNDVVASGVTQQLFRKLPARVGSDPEKSGIAARPARQLAFGRELRGSR